MVDEFKSIEMLVRTKEGEGLEKAMNVSVSEVEGVDGEKSELCEFPSELEKSADDESCVVVLAAVHNQGVDIFRKICCAGERLQDSVETTLRSNIEIFIDVVSTPWEPRATRQSAGDEGASVELDRVDDPLPDLDRKLRKVRRCDGGFHRIRSEPDLDVIAADPGGLPQALQTELGGHRSRRLWSSFADLSFDTQAVCPPGELRVED